MEEISILDKYLFGYEYIYLPLPQETFSNLPESLELEGKKFKRKNSFHVSLLCTKNINSVLVTEKDILSTFEDFVKNNPIEVIGFQNKFHHAKRIMLKVS